MDNLFGTDGIRGIANDYLTPELAYKIGRAGAYVLSNGNTGNIVVGRDTRKSGDMLEAALISGICSTGLDVISVGVVPTPAVAYITRKYDALAGVVISASHNPIEYNGIKFFDENGFKLNDSVETEIEKYIKDIKSISCRPTGEKIGRKIVDKNGELAYIKFLKGTIDTDLSGLKVAVDCGNGAAYKIAPKLFEELNAKVEVINDKPNGVNINVECGSTNLNMVKKLVTNTGADIGLAFDGDADRLIAVDEKGNTIDGDHILAICATQLKEEKKLKNNTIVGTIMTNMGLDKYLENKGIDIIKTKVGDRYVLKEMYKNDYILGGEQSGHIIFLEYNTTGDGILTALQLMAVMKKRNQKMSKLNNMMTSLPQVLKNARVEESFKHKYQEDRVIKKEIEKLEEELEGEGRVIIRPSGTEPLVRVMIEGNDEEKIKDMALRLARLIESRSK